MQNYPLLYAYFQADQVVWPAPILPVASSAYRQPLLLFQNSTNLTFLYLKTKQEQILICSRYVNVKNECLMTHAIAQLKGMIIITCERN